MASRRIIFAEGLRRKLVDTSVTSFRTQTALVRGKKGGRSVYDLKYCNFYLCEFGKEKWCIMSEVLPCILAEFNYRVHNYSCNFGIYVVAHVDCDQFCTKTVPLKGIVNFLCCFTDFIWCSNTYLMLIKKRRHESSDQLTTYFYTNKLTLSTNLL